jgi:hypothetical protein
MLNYSVNTRKNNLPKVGPRGGVPSTEFTRLRGEPGTHLERMEEALKFEAVEGWDTLRARLVLRDAWVEWASTFANWKTFITLTFKDEKYPDVALSLFRWWVRVNNEYVFGKHYNKKVGHSYFSYLVGTERQTREVLHFHVLIDKPINYSLTHQAWGNRCGFAWIDGNLDDKGKVVEYVTKYVAKGGELDLYKAKKDYYPNPVPSWWKENEVQTLSMVQPPLFLRPVELAQPLTG